MTTGSSGDDDLPDLHGEAAIGYANTFVDAATTHCIWGQWILDLAGSWQDVTDAANVLLENNFTEFSIHLSKSPESLPLNHVGGFFIYLFIFYFSFFS